MSGGVDSSVAALLSIEEGLSVEGATLLLSDGPGSNLSQGVGTSPSHPAQDGPRIAQMLGIPHRLVDARMAFLRHVIEPFARIFGAGRTPNPCVSCNVHIKFGLLLDLAIGLGADRLVTGHYARVERSSSGACRLLRGIDRGKDQAYFLYRLGQHELAHSEFPLGGLTKTDVRGRAENRGLFVARKEESQDICFAPNSSHRKIVEQHLGFTPKAGSIVHIDGRILGQHRGIHRYTVGQRRGLGIASSEPLYVVALNRDSSEIVVGSARDLERHELVLGDVSWVSGKDPGKRPLLAQIRHRQREVPASLDEVHGDTAIVRLREPVRGAAPGQAVVLYDGDEILGGGTLEEVR